MQRVWPIIRPWGRGTTFRIWFTASRCSCKDLTATALIQQKQTWFLNRGLVDVATVSPVDGPLYSTTTGWPGARPAESVSLGRVFPVARERQDHPENVRIEFQNVFKRTFLLLVGRQSDCYRRCYETCSRMNTRRVFATGSFRETRSRLRISATGGQMVARLIF